jgi:hypothetical protein
LQAVAAVQQAPMGLVEPGRPRPAQAVMLIMASMVWVAQAVLVGRVALALDGLVTQAVLPLARVAAAAVQALRTAVLVGSMERAAAPRGL